MFCDEPTSGLDSYTAQNIIEVTPMQILILNESFEVMEFKFLKCYLQRVYEIKSD